MRTKLYIIIITVLGLTLIAMLFINKNLREKGVSITRTERPTAIDTPDALQNIANRKSVRKYVANKDVEKEKIEKMLRAAMAAPSGKNTQPWEFIIVKNRAVLDSMAANLPYAQMLKGAPLAIVVCADTTKSNYWYVDCAAATENLLLAAESLGLGAVWTATYPYKDRMNVVEKFLATPANIRSLCVVPIGYPNGDEIPKDKWNPAKIHTDKW